MVPQVIFHQRTLSSSSYRSFRDEFCRVLSMQVYKAGSFGRSLHGSEQLIHWSRQDHVGTIWVKLKCQSVQVTLIVRMIKFFQKYPQWPTKRNRSNFIHEAWREKGWARSKIIEKRSNVMGTYFEIIFPPGFLWFSLTSSSKTVTKSDESRPPRWKDGAISFANYSSPSAAVTLLRSVKSWNSILATQLDFRSTVRRG